MTRFIVKFFKHVIGENGHEMDACQGAFEVSGKSHDDAVDSAKRAFCERGHLSDWSIRADYFSIAETEYPS